MRSAPLRKQPTFLEAAVDFYRPYKFVIAFENSLALDYASEKVWTAIHADAVPIYWGNPQIANYFNPERFINAFDFDNLESLARHVMRVHKDDALYLRYLSQPSRTPRQETKRWKKYTRHGNLSAMNRKFRRMRKTFAVVWNWRAKHAARGFFVSWVRLMTGRALPLAQRRMFHRECLSRFAHETCERIAAERLRLTGWISPMRPSGRHRISHAHIWPHPVFYEVVDMAGQLDAKAS